MNNIQFSIIIPVYNIEAYIGQCVDSVIDQIGDKDYEVILVDDGSTDSCGKICDEYAGKYDYVHVYHKENGGLSSARNYGIKNAHGDYLVFVDGDDYIKDNALQMCRDKLKQADNLSVDVICSEGYYIEDETGEKVRKYFNSEHFDNDKGGFVTGLDMLRYTLGIISNWSACFKFYRREYWQEKGYSFIEGRYSEDMQFIDSVILEARYVCMIQPFYIYRYRIGSITHNYSKKNVIDITLNLGDWDAYFDTHDVEKEIESGLRHHLARAYLKSAVANVYNVPSEEIGAAYNAVREKKDWLRYLIDKEGRLVLLATKVIGFRLTCFVLAIIKRGRIKRIESGSQVIC